MRASLLRLTSGLPVENQPTILSRELTRCCRAAIVVCCCTSSATCGAASAGGSGSSSRRMVGSAVCIPASPAGGGEERRWLNAACVKSAEALECMIRCRCWLLQSG